MNNGLAWGTILFVLGQIIVWFQLNSQLVWEWWEDKPVLTALIFSMPISIMFWYGTKVIYAETGSAWASRYVGFATSYLTFPLLTWWFLQESMFTPKTLVCTALAILIMCVQVFWK
jgi:hypothetical protein